MLRQPIVRPIHGQRICPRCGDVFHVMRPAQRFCCAVCKQAYDRERKTELDAKTATCIKCQQPFRPRNPSHKLCSRACRLIHARPVSLRRDGIPSGTIGAISELIVATKLMADGYHVFRALSPHCICDLIAIKGGETRYVEVRTGQRTIAGCITYPKKHHPSSTEFAVYVRETNEIFFFPIVKPKQVESSD